MQNKSFSHKTQEGQILLIVVLVMVVVLTVGLSVVARTINNVRTSAEEASSERAFSAAEAGIEQALTNNVAVTGSFANKAQYQTTINPLSGLEMALNNGAMISKDDGVDVWLAQYPDYSGPWNGYITVYWGKPSDVCNPSESVNTMAAIEVIIISGIRNDPNPANQPKLTHYAIDPCAARRALNNFDFGPPGQTRVKGVDYNYKWDFNIKNGLIMRIVPLYASTYIGVKGCDSKDKNCNALPRQGDIIESVGTADGTQRKIVSYRAYPRLPGELFQFVFLSPK